MERVVQQFLQQTANAVDITDVNIAAGEALEVLAADRRRLSARRARRTVGLALAACLSSIAIGDMFAASPVQAGVAPWPHAHILTRLGLPSWDTGQAELFNHRLPWRTHDGWLVRTLSTR